ncbi:hypothetical protein AVEN_217602-1 [Araneus ventricosus]|uniref:Uncharacterized protein n=1 Tax=Araneus ventricosus TaxID=182803 RepID=A0A4Y2FHU5_ARAVE|nr:hypothetical protein AVEN_217602-1 [Araneus ventricosus]
MPSFKWAESLNLRLFAAVLVVSSATNFNFCTSYKLLRVITKHSTVMLGIHEKASYVICPNIGFFPSILVEKLGKAFTDVPKVHLRQDSKSQKSCHPDSSSPTLGISSFISSLDARRQCRRGLSRSQIGIGGLSFVF